VGAAQNIDGARCDLHLAHDDVGVLLILDHVAREVAHAPVDDGFKGAQSAFQPAGQHRNDRRVGHGH